MSRRLPRRDWRLGRHFERRLTWLTPVPRPAAPLYALGTAARIERIRLLYLRGGFPNRGRDPYDAGWQDCATAARVPSGGPLQPLHLSHQPERPPGEAADVPGHAADDRRDARRFSPAAAGTLSLVPPAPRVETDYAAEHQCGFWAALEARA